jgi:hypothetical protein
MYAFQRGPGAKRRVMHLAKFDAHGNIIGCWCGFPRINTTINVPLKRPVCKVCKRKSGDSP